MNQGRTDQAALKVSVVLPNYNHARYLERTIQGFLNQTLPPAEIIIVDDASTDDSCRVIGKLASEHPQVIPLRRTENGGVNAALADGLARASCPFVTFSAADDVFLPDFLLVSATTLARHPDAALVFSDPAEIIDATGEEKRYPNFFGPDAACWTPQEFSDIQRRRSFRISSNTVMFRRERLLDIGGFLPEHHWHADWLAIMRLGLSHGVCYRPGVLSYFRVREGSYSQTSLTQTDRHADVVDACLKTIYESGDEELASRFRHAALMPQHELSLVLRLMGRPSFRKHVTPTLLGWLLVRNVWSTLRPLVSTDLRRRVRELLNSR